MNDIECSCPFHWKSKVDMVIEIRQKLFKNITMLQELVFSLNKNNEKFLSVLRESLRHEPNIFNHFMMSYAAMVIHSYDYLRLIDTGVMSDHEFQYEYQHTVPPSMHIIKFRSDGNIIRFDQRLNYVSVDGLRFLVSSSKKSISRSFTVHISVRFYHNILH